MPLLPPAGRLDGLEWMMRSAEETERDYRLAISSIVIFVVGAVCIVVGLLNLKGPAYDLHGAQLTPEATSLWPPILRDIGLAGVAVGGCWHRL